MPDFDNEVWAGPLEGKKWATALLNRDATSPATITVSWSMLNAMSDQSYSVRNVWAGKDEGVHKGSYTATVPPQAVAYLVLTPT